MKQMKEAPQGAIFVWCNDRMQYPTALARELERRDLKIIAPRDLNWPAHKLSGLNVPLIVDHAANLTWEQSSMANTYAAMRYPAAPSGTPGA